MMTATVSFSVAAFLEQPYYDKNAYLIYPNFATLITRYQIRSPNNPIRLLL